MSLLPAVTLDTGPDPASSIIWLHGLGADGNDFASIASELDLDGCGAVRFVFPHAPVIPITLYNGYLMRAWFDLLSDERPRPDDLPNLAINQAHIEALIAHEKARGVPANRIVLAGFSQGCVMALHTALRHPQALAGILCLSGWLACADTVAEQRNPANQDTPIFWGHGEYDNVVPLQSGIAARTTLGQLGYQVQWHQYFTEHAVCDPEILDIGAWLRKVLAKEAPKD